MTGAALLASSSLDRGNTEAGAAIPEFVKQPGAFVKLGITQYVKELAARALAGGE